MRRRRMSPPKFWPGMAQSPAKQRLRLDRAPSRLHECAHTEPADPRRRVQYMHERVEDAKINCRRQSDGRAHRSGAFTQRPAVDAVGPLARPSLGPEARNHLLGPIAFNARWVKAPCDVNTHREVDLVSDMAPSSRTEWHCHKNALTEAGSTRRPPMQPAQPRSPNSCKAVCRGKGPTKVWEDDSSMTQ